MPGTGPVYTCPGIHVSRAPFHFILKVSQFGGRLHGHLLCGALRTVPGTSWTLDPWEP